MNTDISDGSRTSASRATYVQPAPSSTCAMPSSPTRRPLERMNSSSGGSRLRAPTRTTSAESIAPESSSIRSGMPHWLPEGELSGVFRSPCASSHTTDRCPWRAGRIFRVDPERDPPLASPVELAERVLQQRQGDPALTPRLAHAERTDEAGARTVGLVAHHRRDLVAVAHHEPQGRVEVRILDEPQLAPLLERQRNEVPLVLERVGHCIVESPRVL